MSRRYQRKNYREIKALVKVVKVRDIDINVNTDRGSKRYSYRYARFTVHVPADWAGKWVLIMVIPLDEVYSLITKGSAE